MMFHVKVFALTFIENLSPFVRLAAVSKKPDPSPRTSLRTFLKSILRTSLQTRSLYSCYFNFLEAVRRNKLLYENRIIVRYIVGKEV